ncbi:LamG-like jellyroll fold domain-containing protein [Neotamlana nanhaiensis]|uniref:LamG-like jellyroll fold domain-containing protein n=1 Tax=Neotamlana nanhaiensis TaxID=1382798 RepID=UPI00069B16C8|nr:LamG-like jellyroll fold domain-containing protein [Tamlana nanhaiensis]
MKVIANPQSWLLLVLNLFIVFCVNAKSDIKVQHLKVDVPSAGLTLNAPFDFTAVSNLSKAFVISSNNRLNSAGLTNLNESLILRSSALSSTGIDYGKGWGNDYFNSLTEAAHWSYSSGNLTEREIQIINFSNVTSAPEIDVTGSNNSIIGDGSNVPVLTNNTDFGKVQIVSETVTKSFIIENTGDAPLTLGAISLSGTTDFSIVAKPTSGTAIASGGTETITISFHTTTEGFQSTTLSIASNDSNESNYQINLVAEGDKVFFDSDNDGVYDDVDVDDDNDGILDSDEENACRLSSSATQADYKFLNETFGTGTGRGTGISSLYAVSTTYCLEDGTPGSSCSGTNAGVGDGEYTVASHITSGTSGETVGPNDAIASWAWYAWAPIEDHTPGDTNGRMAIFNASYDPGIFYETQITGTLANVPVTYSFWAANIDEPDQSFINQENGGNASAFSHRILPNVTVNFLTLDRNTVIATFDTGDITRCGDTYTAGDHTGTYPHAADATYNTCETSVWQQFTQQFTTSETAFIVQFVNNAPGGAGNDLALDDIEVRQTLCDMDSDGVADVFDLDSDNDGIPDVVEGNPTSASLSEGKASLTGVSTWVDANGNGMHDSIEGISPINSDTDLTPNYLDLDSDNDGIFDVDEYKTISTSAPANFENGDGDINGDGVGDGLETEAFREKDAEGDDIIEYYGDGILDVYDFHQGASTYPASYGNINQGSAPYFALDTDSDGIPNYIDPTNDITGINDIDTVEIYAHLTNTLGVLDDTTDLDGDGIVASRDSDDSVFGSPRDLNDSYSLSFDGRNDYVEDSNVISSGSATLMAFIKSNGANTNTNNQIIAGQNDFYIQLNSSDNTISAISEGITLTSSSSITTGIWTHITITTQSGGDVVLYINGNEEARDISGSGGITSASNFIIGSSATNNNYFKGEIDEVRVFNTALSETTLNRSIYQELDETNSFNSGKIVPADIAASFGSNLIKYYKMDAYQDDILDDKTTGTRDAVGAKMYNFKDIYFQRAPMPYETASNGNWTDSSSWLYGDQWDISTKQNNPDEASIIHIKHNITVNGSYITQGTSGLIIDSGNTLTIPNDKGFFNNWHLELDGKIDLEGDSQFIQSANSTLDATSAGTLEKDQQGTADTYTYNYWSSPVGFSNASTNNNSYAVPNVISNINFLTYGYNGTSSPVAVADYWIWKFNNLPSNDYSSWQHVRSTGTLQVGEGFTMKGPGTGSITDEQTYVFEGKPNNGDINLPITAGNEYLIGNPYPSAIDANQFILDNGANIASAGASTGTLYFWEHWGGNSHALGQYQGGYATYTLAGGVPAASQGSSHPDVATGGVPTKTPGRFIPVGQGFFVEAENSGSIQFNNGQRVFQVEDGTNSVYFKSRKSKEDRKEASKTTLRIAFNSVNTIRRQLLLAIDEACSDGFDWGYDAKNIDKQIDDMYWLIDNEKYTIQGINNLDEQTILPLGVHTKKTGINSFALDDFKNNTNNLDVLLHDRTLDIYHNLNTGNYEVQLNKGTYLDRFEITFAQSSNQESLSISEAISKNIDIYFSNKNKNIVINNPKSHAINNLTVFNIIGQNVIAHHKNGNGNNIVINTKHLASGTYILKLNVENHTISKKVLVE